MNDIESLAKKCFEEKAKLVPMENERQHESDFVSWPQFCAGWLLIIFFAIGFFVEPLGAVILLLIVAWTGGTFLDLKQKKAKTNVKKARHTFERTYIRKRLAAYADGDLMSLQQVHGYAIRHFRKLIKQHRARTMGPESEWARARAPLEKAVNDANKSVAYWRERLKSDPDNQVCLRQYRIVKGLEEKLRSALSKVDERADLLSKFYNDCEAKLAVMDRCRQDIREARKVEELSSRADVVVAEAEGSIQALASAFVDEAQRIGSALGETAGAQYKVLAGEAPLDDIDYLADKIVECSDGEQEQIKEMQNRLAE